MIIETDVDVRPHLTARQLEVLELLAQGLQSKEIGAKLHLSTKTIKAFSLQARRALGAKNTVHAIALAHRYGLLDPCEVAS